MFRQSLLSAALIGAVSILALAPQSVGATTTGPTQSILVTAHVVNTCEFNAAAGPNVDFGLYDPIFANQTADITVPWLATYTCTAGEAATTTFSFHSATSGGTNPCELHHTVTTSNLLTYTISDGTHTTFCDGTAFKNAAETVGTGVSQSVSFNFILLHGQTTAIAGNYTDTNTVTIAP